MWCVAWVTCLVFLICNHKCLHFSQINIIISEPEKGEIIQLISQSSHMTQDDHQIEICSIFSCQYFKIISESNVFIF